MDMDIDTKELSIHIEAVDGEYGICYTATCDQFPYIERHGKTRHDAYALLLNAIGMKKGKDRKFPRGISSLELFRYNNSDKVVQIQ